MDENKKPRIWTRFMGWAKRHKHLSISLLILLVIIISALSAFIVYSLNHKTEKIAVVAKPVIVKKPVAATVYYSPLTGEVVPTLATTTLPVTAVMIENSTDARPQSGLKQAGVVFEAIAEGGITRFMALYQQEKPQTIGPVRSLRIYDIDWFVPFDASIAHVGGSAAALTEVRNGKYRDIDQFFNGSYYTRTTDRYAPHNVYTSFAKLDALNTSKGYTTSKVVGFPRVTGKASSAPTASTVAITISGPDYNTAYVYDKTTNTYLRSEGGAPHMDREEGQLDPAVVIAMHVQESTVMQDGNREAITTIGSGKATIFQNGTATDVTWTKATQASQITFTGADGKVVPLIRGQTWITAVPSDGGSVSWQ